MFRYLGSYIWAENQVVVAAGRNMPAGFQKAIQDAKRQLHTDISHIVPVRRTEVDVVRSNLRPTRTRTAPTEYPCTNPLFQELRLRFTHHTHA